MPAVRRARRVGVLLAERDAPAPGDAPPVAPGALVAASLGRRRTWGLAFRQAPAFEVGSVFGVPGRNPGSAFGAGFGRHGSSNQRGGQAADQRWPKKRSWGYRRK